MSMFDRLADHVAAILQDAADTEDRDEGLQMHQMIDDLLARGWAYTNAGRCEPGDEVLVLGNDKDCPVPDVITGASGNHVQTKCGLLDEGQLVLQAPRPESVFERGEVWRCRNNETGEEGNLARSSASWRGTFPGCAAGVWRDDEVTPFRKLLNADGTAPAQGLPEWDPEREWPMWTVVEADTEGEERGEYIQIAPASWRPLALDSDGWHRSIDLHNVRVLSVPGHPAPTGPSLRERLLDEGTGWAVARAVSGRKSARQWEYLSESAKALWVEKARTYLAAAADVLDPEGEQA